MIIPTARLSALGLATASLMLCAAAPASARTSAAYLTDGSTMTFDGKSGNYCLRETITGSHLPQVTCQSKDAWAADGLNISRK